MVAFTLPKDPTESPKDGSLRSGREYSGKCTKYGPGGPGGSGGSGGAGPTGKTTGPAGVSPVNFSGSPNAKAPGPWPQARRKEGTDEFNRSS
jgi:hypothetical protein